MSIELDFVFEVLEVQAESNGLDNRQGCILESFEIDNSLSIELGFVLESFEIDSSFDQGLEMGPGPVGRTLELRLDLDSDGLETL